MILSNGTLDHVRPSVSPQPNPDKKRALEESIATLAELFPTVFVAAAGGRASRLDLIERGALPPANCGRELGRYCARRACHVALSAGGTGIDLDGRPSGEVTAAEQETAKGVIAHLDKLMVQKAATAKAALRAERDGERAASMAQEKPAAKTVTDAEASPKPPSSLADLKRASLVRKQGLEEFAVVQPK